MPGHRMDRVTGDIKREVSEIIRGLKDPRVSGIVSIVKVEVTQDLAYAKIYVSSVGSDLGQTVKGLNNAAGFVRKELSSRLTIRKTPEIKFIADDSIEKSARISKIIDEISKDD
ncbi:MAG TPA: 30S ribosome-binding factor RbfA [Clostridia bacterium]|nr:30S ribosome-binding factor RbfA [Clostridia bacterium]